jgi:glutamyl-tRNA synthetase
MNIKTRFAPSPTGYIHLGNARTAIISALACRHNSAKEQGSFMLRIEDTDKERSENKFIEAVCEDFNSLGLKWQEGERMGGEFAPYRQSQRLDIYQKYFDELLCLGYAYRCFCTQDDLLKMRREQKLSGMPPRYDGRCCRLDQEVIEQRVQDKQPFVLRFNTKFNHSPDAEIIFNDLVKGKQRFPRHEIGDFIIRKEDGMPTFFFSNAVDDSLMQVSHVLRGDDHLTNTPRQIMILEALQLPLPQYAHLATVMGEDGTPLSKRNGSRSIRELISEGWLPLAIVNYLSRLGHYYADDKLMSLEELGAGFDFSNLGKSATKFDWSLLSHWQRQALMAMDEESLWQWMSQAIGNKVAEKDKLQFAGSVSANILLPQEAVKYTQMIYQQDIDFTAAQLEILQNVEDGFFAEALTTYQQGGKFVDIIKNIQKRFGCKGKQLYQPLRIILTGENHGPEMAQLLELIPKELVVKRLQRWIR